jgi:hypothetical protein
LLREVKELPLDSEISDAMKAVRSNLPLFLEEKGEGSEARHTQITQLSGSEGDPQGLYRYYSCP